MTDINYRYSQEDYTFMVEKVVKDDGKYEAYGYCMVDGIRDDLCVKKFYPQNKGEIPNARANGWVLIDVPGVDMNELFPIHSANEVIKSGKHKGKTYAEAYRIDSKYIDWLRNSNPYFKIDLTSLSDNISNKEKDLGNLLDECDNTRPLTKIEDKIPFGKYKGKTFHDVYSINPQYVKWLLNNCDTIIFDAVSFNSLLSDK